MFFEKTDKNIDEIGWTSTKIESQMMHYKKMLLNMPRRETAKKNRVFLKASRRKNGKVMRCYLVKQTWQHIPGNSGNGDY